LYYEIATIRPFELFSGIEQRLSKQTPEKNSKGLVVLQFPPFFCTKKVVLITGCSSGIDFHKDKLRARRAALPDAFCEEVF
jgi:hypothetical protein